jgi:curli biogenesis system outer membrane secretion channel CsgG
MKIAILDFTYNKEKIDSGIVLDIEDLFHSAFINTGSFTVIERSKLDQLYKELDLQQSDEFNEEFIQELGNMFGVETVLLGSVTRFGESYVINIRGVSVSTGVGIFADTLSVDSES